MYSNDWKKAEDVLMAGGIAIVPTDTLYGILGKASSKKTVERIYEVRGRDTDKPCIILISSYKDLESLGIKLKNEDKKILDMFWPGKVSVIFPCSKKNLQYLHRGTNTLAIRMIGPRNKNLFNILKKTGPLVAPSANPQGMPPALSRKEARKYFGKTIDAYVCVGTKNSKPSTLVEYTDGKLNILRQGGVVIK